MASKNSKTIPTFDKDNKLTGSQPTIGRDSVPTASPFVLEQDILKGATVQSGSEESNYEILHQKMKSRLSFAESEQLFETNKEKVKRKIEELEGAQSVLESSQYYLWTDFESKGAEVMNTHRPVYDLEKITLENQGDWDAYRECFSCQVAYPCTPYLEAKNALDKHTPVDEHDFFSGQQGRKVTLMLEEEADKYARDNVSQILSNGMTRGAVLPLADIKSFPIGLMVRGDGAHNLWIKTRDNGWASVYQHAPGWYKTAVEDLKNGTFNISPHPFSRSKMLVLEGFITK